VGSLIEHANLLASCWILCQNGYTIGFLLASKRSRLEQTAKHDRPHDQQDQHEAAVIAIRRRSERK